MAAKCGELNIGDPRDDRIPAIPALSKPVGETLACGQLIILPWGKYEEFQIPQKMPLSQSWYIREHRQAASRYCSGLQMFSVGIQTNLESSLKTVVVDS